MPELVLGPLLRYVDETSATVWVETDQPCTVRVLDSRVPHVHGPRAPLRPGRRRRPRTRQQHAVRGPPRRRSVLARPGAAPAAEPDPDARPEPAGSGWSSARAGQRCRTTSSTTRPTGSTRCARSVTDSSARRSTSGPTRSCSSVTRCTPTSRRSMMKEFIDTRRSLDEPPGAELADFEEYAKVYQLAWSDPSNRWLLSTVPSMMIFDDHDIRDDWNTSVEWRAEMAAQPWWHKRIVGGLGSYWVFQHAGNLSIEERATDPLYAAIEADRRRRRVGAGRVRRAGRQGARAQPVELLPRHRSDPARGAGLEVRPRAAARSPQDPRRRRVGLVRRPRSG